VGSRSATPLFMEEAAALLPELDLPEATVVGLEEFGEAVRMFREGTVLKVVVVP